MTAPALQTLWARLLLGTLARAEVRHWVISPGSRSTPLAVAALRCSELDCALVLDERSAGFFALGWARASQSAVGLLCTSGTAVGNYLPAVMEASQSGVPLVLLTADRPPELQDCSAPQTLDQVRVFGSFVRAAVEFGEPSPLAQQWPALRRRVLSTVEKAQGPLPGPVHFNVPLRKPLEPVALPPALEQQLAGLIASALPPAKARVAAPSQQRLTALAQRLREQPRGVITCGFSATLELAQSELARLAQRTGYPVLLDIAHPWRQKLRAELRPWVIAAYDATLRCDPGLFGAAPELILQVGPGLVSAAWERYLAGPAASAELLLFSATGWPETTGRAVTHVEGALGLTLPALAAALPEPASQRVPYAATWRAGAARVQAELPAALETAAARHPASELSLIASLLSTLPEDSELVLGNSLPLREVDLLGAAVARGVTTHALRGVNGIDGLVSFASGLARGSGKPTTLLLGDMSFLHDVGGLFAARRVTTPLVVVVIDNGGGRIFEQLPVHSAVTPRELEYWTTPHDCQLTAAASLYGVALERASSRDELCAAMGRSFSHAGATLLVVKVDPDSSAKDTRELVAELRRRLASPSADGVK